MLQRYTKDYLSAPLGLGYKLLVQIGPPYPILVLRTYFDVPPWMQAHLLWRFSGSWTGSISFCP